MSHKHTFRRAVLVFGIPAMFSINCGKSRLVRQKLKVVELVKYHHHSKCLPVLSYATEVCVMLSRDKQSLEFTFNSFVHGNFRTTSPTVVTECQRNFFVFFTCGATNTDKNGEVFASFCCNGEQFVSLVLRWCC